MEEDDGWGNGTPLPDLQRTESWGTTGSKNDETEWPSDPEEPSPMQPDWSAEPEEEILKGIKVGNFECVKTDYLKQQVHRISKDFAGTMEIPLGVSMNILRGFKWNKNRAGIDIFSEEHPKTYTTMTTKETKESKVRCMFYASIDLEAKGKKPKKSKKHSALENKVGKMIEDGKTQQVIIRALIRKKYKPADVMKAFNAIQAKIAEKILKSENLTECEKGRGLVSRENATRLRCGHWGCKDCWKDALTHSLATGREIVNYRCQKIVCKNKKCSQHKSDTGCFCEEAVPREVFDEFLGEKGIDQYDRWMAWQFALDKKKEYSHCPAPNCEYWLKQLPMSNSSRAECVCGKVFCFYCHRKCHSPVPCRQYEDFLERGGEKNVLSLWLKSRTFPCPKCKAPIEKNRACLHMSCICGHHFCWACKKNWNGIGHGYYNCPSYKKDKESKKYEVEAQKSTREYRKFKFYDAQMDIIREDIKLIQKKKDKFEKEMENSCRDLNTYSFIFEALDTLLQAKEQMIYLVITAFYFSGRKTQWTCLKCTFLNAGTNKKCTMCGRGTKPVHEDMKGAGGKDLFEQQQKLMVQVTNNLMKLFSKDQKLDEILQNRKNVVTVRNACDKFVRKVVEDVDDGVYTNFILDAPDESIEGWYCVLCKKMNDFGKPVCSSQGCDACQVHGEAACLRCNPH
uniref:RBR-type E3 ubiquitin transferase n=1 Tax=Amorphochlora amoebiformis TaxID=1561963 RepID=A0A7S0CQY3_9EUKA